MQIIIATVVKNEAHRYWQSCLDSWGSFADKIVVLDDGSTDETRSIAEAHPKTDVFILPDTKDLWGHEAPHRAALFNYAMGSGEPGDVVFWLDADMVPSRDPRRFFEGVSNTTFAFYLYDLWGTNRFGELQYRVDPPWVAHDRPRVWALRIPEDLPDYDWGVKRGIHSGHIPAGWWLDIENQTVIVPRSVAAILHYGYHTEDDRKARYDRYMSVSKLMSDMEIAHAKSILEQPETRPIDIITEITLAHSG